MKGLIKFSVNSYTFQHLDKDGNWDVSPGTAYMNGLEDGVKISEYNLRRLLDDLYSECEHGDKEHRQWLKDKFEDFYNRNK